jgi:predicted Zn-dependent protease
VTPRSIVHRHARVVATVLNLAGIATAGAHGDVHEQIVALTREIDSKPGDATLYHKRGELFRAHDEPSAALEDFARAKAIKPSLHAVDLSQGRVLLETGRAGESDAVLTTFLRQEPGHADALLLRARARAQLSRYVDADDDFAAAIAAVPDPGPDLFLERAANLKAAGHPEEALQVLNAALRRIDRAVTLQEAALNIETELALWISAIQRLDTMMEAVPVKAPLLARKADVQELAGQPQEARRTREAALAEINALPATRRETTWARSLQLDLQERLSPSPAP